jgi:putative addiction module antidote protein, CC2985 family
MSTVEKISIALTPDLASLVRNAVDKGYYASTSEVIREALRDWKNKQTLNEQKTQELRALWQEGINSGSAGGLNMAEIKQEARQHYEQERQKSAKTG